jgi:Zn-dependent protease
MVWVAAAGPATNILLALAAGFMVHLVDFLPDGVDRWFFQNLENAIIINVVLAVFNMIPLPPLDGGRVAVGLLPDALAMPLARLERFGMLIIIGLLFILPMIGTQLGTDLNVLAWLISGPANSIIGIIVRITGNA